MKCCRKLWVRFVRPSPFKVDPPPKGKAFRIEEIGNGGEELFVLDIVTAGVP